MMSWEELINHLLTSSTTVDKVAVYDGKGRPVAITADVETCDSDGLALVKCMSDLIQTVTKLNIGNHIYHCYHGTNQLLFGRKVRDASSLMIARQEGEFVVVIMGQSDGHDSFIQQLNDGLRRKAEGTLIGQQPQLPQSQSQMKTQQPQPNSGQLLPMPPTSPRVHANRNAVTTEEVLVDITG